MPGTKEKWFQPLLASHCAGRGGKIKLFRFNFFNETSILVHPVKFVKDLTLGEPGGDDNPAGGGRTTKPENKSKSILARQVS